MPNDAECEVTALQVVAQLETGCIIRVHYMREFMPGWVATIQLPNGNHARSTTGDTKLLAVQRAYLRSQRLCGPQ